MPRSNDVRAALEWLENHSTERDRANLVKFNITAGKAFGVSMANVQVLAKRLGRDHELALALWDTGWYEARLLTSFVDEPERVTAKQMERWTKDFDNWGICDTLCFHLFDRTPHAWGKARQWSTRSDEFVKRCAFALLWSLSVHDKQAPDEPFLEGLGWVERAASDERHLVKKAVNMALRAVGKRGPRLHAAALETARRLAASPDATPRWIGKDALRELNSPSVRRRVAPKAEKKTRRDR